MTPPSNSAARVVDRVDELAQVLPRSNGGGRLALVPTMGALHAGHRELLRVARGRAHTVVMSLFVNPLQFGPSEDLDRYPRTFDADVAMAADEGVDLIFAPGIGQMYPGGSRGQVVTVHAVGPLAERLEGAARPGHFDGVLTVVTKLLTLVRPDVAVFGQKDAQQLALVRRMVADLSFPVEIVAVPTVREPDGLALSSRNAYLNEAERTQALVLSRALIAGTTVAARGAPSVLRAVDETLAEQPNVRLDYRALVDPATFIDVEPTYTGDALLLLAARVGSTRLIDNATLTIGAQA
ncbi:MAG: pantoate--beta-alanine ligase [Candidatus Nanopelagicales bacterium]